MTPIRPHSTGLALGLFVALWHILWAGLVWAGAAQAVIDFIFRLHMIDPPYRITAFSMSTGALLVVVTGAIGYSAGWLIGFIWNSYLRRTTTNA